MTFLSRLVRGEVLLMGVFSCAFALSALAQNSSPVSQVGPGSTASITPARGVVPAPANTPQKHILDAALTPKTRQTLQEAMDSAGSPSK